MTEIPEPVETGTSGTQEAEVRGVLANIESPIEGLPIAQAVAGLASSHARSMGGEVAAGLISGSFAQISHNLQETKDELQGTRKKLDRAREELSEYKIKAAVLQERVNAFSKTRYLKNFIIMVGTALFGLAIELYRNNLTKLAYVLGALGGFAMLLGWFSRKEGAEK